MGIRAQQKKENLVYALGLEFRAHRKAVGTLFCYDGTQP